MVDDSEQAGVQIEITPAMLEAGELALADIEELFPAQAAKLAFQAMIGNWLSSSQALHLLRQEPSV